MRTSLLPPPSRRAAPVLALAALSAAVPLLAQAGDSTVAAIPGFPEPFPLAMVLVPLCGALGAFAADIVADGGRIERWRRDEGGWTLGVAGKLVVGLVAAIVFITLNPPNDSWPALVGSALVAGLGGEAMLLAIIASRHAQEMEQRSQEEVDHSIGDLNGLAAITRAAGADRAIAKSAGGAALFDGEPEGGTLQEIVDAYTENAIAEVRRRAGRASAR